MSTLDQLVIAADILVPGIAILWALRRYPIGKRIPRATVRKR